MTAKQFDFAKALLAGASILVSMAALSGQTSVDLGKQGRNIDFSGAAATKPFQTGSSLPASCDPGQAFFLTSAAAGRNTYGCTAANTWTLQSGLGLPDFQTNANQVLSNDGSHAGWQAVGGDVSGPVGSLNVVKLQGRVLAGTAPSDGQVLRWNSSSHDWEPGSAQLATNFSKSFNNSNTLTVLGSEHGFGTANLIVNCYDSATPANSIAPASMTVNRTTFNVGVTFASATSGSCVVNGSGGNGFAPAAGGDLSGVVNTATVTGLQGRPVSVTAPSDGQVLTWNASSAKWTPQSQSTPFSNTGGTSLNTLGVTNSSPATLSLSAGCTSVAPCNVRFGGTNYSVVNSSTVTLQGGTGTAYVYLTSNGVLTVGSTLNLTCSSGCNLAPGATSFPANSIPLYTWNAINGVWDASSGRDVRAFLSSKVISSGTGIIVVESGTQSTIAVDSAVVPGYINGSATFGFGNIASGSCSAEQTIPVPGASPGDSVAAGWPASLPVSLIGMMRVSSADTVSVKLCNLSGSATGAPIDVFQATVVRSL